MNKQEYLYALDKALRTIHVPDSADIVEEYAEHFDMKLRDGYSEEEVAAKLASPKDIAGQFADIRSGSVAKKGNKIILSTGLGFTDIFTGAFFIMLYAWVAVLGVLTLASAGLGVVLILKLPLWSLIPEMPYICSLLIGLSLLALCVLSAMGTEYCRLYVTQLLKVYARWHKAVSGNAGHVLPPAAIHPPIKAKKRRFMRSAALISLAVFAVCLIAGMVSMMIAAGSFEPWHVWHWFQ